MSILTREEILAEPAGPRMDAWVAEFVMGWQVDDAIPTRYRVPLFVDGDVTFAAEPFKWQPWKPSEDMAAAWQVVEAVKLKYAEGYVAMSFCRSAAGNPDYRYECSVAERIYGPDGWADTIGKYRSFVEGPSMPLVICRAALLATLHKGAKST